MKKKRHSYQGWEVRGEESRGKVKGGGASLHIARESEVQWQKKKRGATSRTQGGQFVNQVLGGDPKGENTNRVSKKSASKKKGNTEKEKGRWP